MQSPYCAFFGKVLRRVDFDASSASTQSHFEESLVIGSDGKVAFVGTRSTLVNLFLNISGDALQFLMGKNFTTREVKKGIIMPGFQGIGYFHQIS